MTGRQYALRGRFSRDINPRADLPTALADAVLLAQRDRRRAVRRLRARHRRHHLLLLVETRRAAL